METTEHDAKLERIRALLVAATHLSADRRAELLRQERDSYIRAEVLALLALDDPAGGFLERPFPELLGATAAANPELSRETLLKDRYRIEQSISRSDFATVYFARDELLKRRVVIKIPDQLHDEATLRQTFDAEFRALAQVQHPSVVGIADLGSTAAGHPFLVLTYVPGVTLREILRQGPVDGERAHRILAGIGQALAAIHKAGVWHLDVKPENIIVSDPNTHEERVTLIDFGIAGFRNLPGKNLAAGTLRYMAPDGTPSAQSDVYALAIIASELLGRPGKKLPSAITKGVSPNPADRFADVQSFLAALPDPLPRNRFLMGTVAAAALLLAVSGVYRFYHPPPEYSTPRAVLTRPVLLEHPIFSPDGTELFYASGRENNPDIYRIALATDAAPSLIAAQVEAPTRHQISPDGRQLVYLRKNRMILRTLATGEEQVLSIGVDLDIYCWTPDSKHIILSSAYGAPQQRLQLLEIRTGAVTSLPINGVSECGLNHPTVSPDGKLLAFACRWAQGSDDLFVAPFGQPASATHRVTNRNARIGSLAWTPDSKSILYVSGPLGEGALWRVQISGGEPIEVPGLPPKISNVTVARNKWTFAVSHETTDSNIWSYQLDGRSAPHAVTVHRLDDEQAYLSPDGRRLLFGSARSGKPQIWVADAAGTNPRPLTELDSADLVSGIWGANSQEAIISVRSKELGERVYTVQVDKPGLLTPLIEGATAVSLSRNRQWLYIVRRTAGKRSIWRTTYPVAATSQSIALDGAFGLESIDGKALYFAKLNEADGIWRQDLKPGSVPVRIVDRLYRRNLFAVGKTGIFFIAPTTEMAPALFFAKDGQRATQLLAFDREVGWGLGLSPDERSVIYTQVDAATSEIIVVDRFR